MKRKLKIVVLATIVAVLCVFVFVACNTDKSHEGEDFMQAAYDHAKELGYTGTLEDFLASIKGNNGADGNDGVGIEFLQINDNGELVVILTDKSQINLGKVKGEQAVSIKNVSIVNGVLKITLSDGSVQDAGALASIASVDVNAKGELVVTSTDGSVLYQGKIPACAHSWSDWNTVVMPTCASIGYNTRTCEICGYAEYAFSEPTGHNFGEWKDVTNACTSHLQVRICSICGDAQWSDVQPGGHMWIDGVCKKCGDTIELSDLNFLDIYNGTYGYEYLGTMEKGAVLQSLYTDIKNAVKIFHANGQTSTDCIVATLSYVRYGLTDDEAVAVWKTFKDDNPLYYWLSSTLQIEGENIVLQTEENYRDGATRAESNKTIYDAVKKYTAYVSKNDSKYQMALAFHDAIINAVDYAYANNGKPESAYWAHSIVGVFQEQGAVCEGYSKTFQLLLNVSGVENLFVTGSGMGTNHAWNMVRLDDGNWYWCDLTWDDTPNQLWGVNYSNFCVIDNDNNVYSKFLQTHTPNDSTAVGVEFLYGLPARSVQPFADKNQALLNDTFTVDNCSFTVVGYNLVEINKISGSGSVKIPETVCYNGVTYTVISIGEYVLDFDSNITEVFVPQSVKFIWDFAFGSRNLKNISVDENNECFCSVDGVLFTKSLYTLIKFPSANEKTTFEITDATREIANGAFSQCKYLQILYVGKNVRIVGIANWGGGYNDGFSYGGNIISGEWARILDALTEGGKIVIDKENSHYESDEFAVWGKEKSAIYCVFDKNLTSYEIPASVQHIEKISNRSICFARCTKLESFTVAEGNQWYSVCDGVLYNKDMTEIIWVPNAIKGTITIPDSVTVIDSAAFMYRAGLTGVVLPKSIIKIENNAFYGCGSLTSVYFVGTQAEWDTISIGEYNDKLKESTGYFYSETEPTTDGNYWHYVDGKVVVWKKQK